MSETRKLAAILVADVVGYSRPAGARRGSYGLHRTNASAPEDMALMLKSAISAVAFGAAFLAAGGAYAFEGRYVAGDRVYRQELTIKKRADGRFDVTAVVGTKGCSGFIDARGAAEGEMLKAEVEFDGGTCVLTLRRTKMGVRVEAENCESFHGASCEFDGDYRKRGVAR
jgi:hypothetical protein